MRCVIPSRHAPHAAEWCGLRRRVLGAAAILGAAMLAAASPVSSAQAQGPPRGRDVPTGRQRSAMEQRVEDRIDALLRERLALTDEQATQLREVSRRIELSRRALRRDESQVRTDLRRELLATSPLNEARIGELMDRLPVLERKRIDLSEQEQRELSKFLAPSQRARYFALQDELRRNLQEGQRRRLGTPPPDSGRMPPGGSRPPVSH